MPVYALLGATGSTGKAIIRALLLSPPPNLTLKIFVRSRSKLLASFPTIEASTSFLVTIIEGTPSDRTTMTAVLSGADVIFGVIGSNLSTPGMSLITDVATSVITALETIRLGQVALYKPPTVIQLRSASLNSDLAAAMPWMARWGAHFAFHHAYLDLAQACTLFREAASEGLLEVIMVDPPSIHDPDGMLATGHRLLTEAGDVKMEMGIMYADLGAGFVEIAARREELRGKAVGVGATGEVTQTIGVLMGYGWTGLKGRLWG